MAVEPEAMQTVLEIQSGDQGRGPARLINLRDQSVSIGRAPDNEVMLNDPLISRHHTRLERDDGRWCLTDLGSANGTQVNGVSLEPRAARPLGDGDAIQIGNFTLVFRQPVVDPEVTMRRPNDATRLAPAASDLTVNIGSLRRPRLVIRAGQAAREVSLDRPMLALGRDTDNDIVVDDAMISRHHAQLSQVDGTYEIADLGSRNGLTFEGKPVKKRLLADGDVVWIGREVSLTYRTEPEIQEVTIPREKFDLRGGESRTIGRQPGSDIHLDHPAVSRSHARIYRRGGAYAIEDLGSTSGTFVNGERLRAHEPRNLAVADAIRIGPVQFIFTTEALESVDESHDLRIDALHLNQVVGKGTNLLQDISLSIQPREFLAIVGVSGSGKSTLLDALSGVRPASAGSVMVNGADLYHNYGAYRTTLGYVPQDDIIHKELTVYAALDYAARLRLPPDTTGEERGQRVMEVLKTLDLVGRKDVPVQRLSGGQRKRVSIGVELLTRPGLFFLDEATSALDPGTEGQIMRLLRGLADDGLTVLLVTHATKNVMLCDQVAFLAKGGYLTYFGPPDEALKYFGVDDFDGIYLKVDSEKSPKEWADQYLSSSQYQRYVVQRLQEKYGVLPKLPPNSRMPAAVTSAATGAAARDERRNAARRQGARPNALRQFLVLCQRYLSIMARDRIGLLMLFLIAPVLGAIDFVAWPRNVLDPTNGTADRAMVMLFMATVIPLLVASLTSVREIVKEAAIYRRERAVGLAITPYLLSKVTIGFLFAIYHAGVLLAIKYIAVDLTHLGTKELGEFYVTLALACMSGVLWGLLISALVPREDQAMILVIVVVVAQIVFSGGLLPLQTAGDAANYIADVTPGKWVFQALTAAAGIKTGDCAGPDFSNCRVPGINAYASNPEKAVLLKTIDDRFQAVFDGDIKKSWAALGGIMVGVFALLWILQKRKDVI